MNPIEQFDYHLPEERIATHPSKRRSDAKLLGYDRKKSGITHSRVSRILEFLQPGDLFVLNNVRVDPARVLWRKESGSPCELLLLKELQAQGNQSVWEALVGGKRLKKNVSYLLPGNMNMKICSRNASGTAEICFEASTAEVLSWRQTYGLPPLPPYIRGARKKQGLSETEEEDWTRYQTTFFKDSGAVAAPTAGLHFTPELLQSLSEKGVELCHLHLAVGWGTFRPLTPEQWDLGKLHEEEVRLSADVAEKILSAKQSGKRVIAVGTTVVRSLEWWVRNGMSPKGIQGPCDLFLKPGWMPEVVDAMVTNFHLPKSSLMALVSGFLGEGGVEKLLELYQIAIEEHYRFYSYGDAMFIA